MEVGTLLLQKLTVLVHSTHAINELYHLISCIILCRIQQA